MNFTRSKEIHRIWVWGQGNWLVEGNLAGLLREILNSSVPACPGHVFKAVLSILCKNRALESKISIEKLADGLKTSLLGQNRRKNAFSDPKSPPKRVSWAKLVQKSVSWTTFSSKTLES